jgi:hypothetical protein
MALQRALMQITVVMSCYHGPVLKTYSSFSPSGSDMVPVGPRYNPQVCATPEAKLGEPFFCHRSHGVQRVGQGTTRRTSTHNGTLQSDNASAGRIAGVLRRFRGFQQ